MAAMTAYYEQKRREEEEAQRAAVHAQFAAEQAEKERQQKAQAKAMAKLEKQWAEEKFKEQAYQQWKEEQEQAKAVDALSAADSGKKVLASPVPNISMSQGLPPEAQYAFMHGGAAAQEWITEKAPDLIAEYQARFIVNSLDKILLNADKYYVWDTSTPPALEPQESLNGKIPVVCADILILSYLDAGIDLSTGIIEFAKTAGGYPFPDHAPRNSVAIKNYLDSQGVLNKFGQSNVPIRAGDMVFSANAGHAGVVHTVIDPNDPSKIFIVQTSILYRTKINSG